MERIPKEVASELLKKLEEAQKQTSAGMSYVLYQISGVISELSREYIDMVYIDEKLTSIRNVVSDIVKLEKRKR